MGPPGAEEALEWPRTPRLSGARMHGALGLPAPLSLRRRRSPHGRYATMV